VTGVPTIMVSGGVDASVVWDTTGLPVANHAKFVLQSSVPAFGNPTDSWVGRGVVMEDMMGEERGRLFVIVNCVVP